jgi:hypothetical protein
MDVWARLDCFKSSSELETGPPLTARLWSSPGCSTFSPSRCEISQPGTMANEAYQATNGTLTIHDITYDRTTGSPKGREPYGDGAPIVVDGVTPIYSDRQENGYRAKGSRSFAC